MIVPDSLPGRCMLTLLSLEYSLVDELNDVSRLGEMVLSWDHPRSEHESVFGDRHCSLRASQTPCLLFHSSSIATSPRQVTAVQEGGLFKYHRPSFHLTSHELARSIDHGRDHHYRQDRPGGGWIARFHIRK